MNNTTATVILERIQNPCATLEMIGQKAGITREGVRQILKRQGLKTTHFRYRNPVLYQCLNCGNPVTERHSKRYCSDKCAFLQRMIPLICDECGRLFYRSKHKVMGSLATHKANYVFCSKQCHGKYAGKHYGFPVNGRSRRKYNWDTVQELHKKGLKTKEISQILNIPRQNIDSYFYKQRKLLTKRG